MTVLITGGAGFIGSLLAERLLNGGHEVVVVDNLSNGLAETVPDEAIFYEMDLAEDDLEAVFEHGIDTVFHLAANADVRVQNEDRMRDFQDGLMATKQLLEVMYRHDVDDLVYTSSSTVYGEDVELPTPESYGPMEPISLYGSSKMGCEAMLSAYAHSFDIETTVLRLANIIGGRSKKGVTYDFVEKLRDDPAELEVLGNGTQQKSYLHIDDCIDALLHAHQHRDGAFEIFNVGNTDSVSVTEIAEIVIDAYDCDAEIHYTGGEKGWTGDVPEMLLDITKLQDRGWEASMSSGEAVRQTANEILSD